MVAVPERHVLLVEDDDDFRTILARELRRHGFATIEATSAEQAKATLRGSARAGLVLLDLNLPGESGWDLLRGALAASADRPPVVVISALTVNPRQLRELGVAGYLPKPFALETLLEVCDRFLAPATPGDDNPAGPGTGREHMLENRE